MIALVEYLHEVLGDAWRLMHDAYGRATVTAPVLSKEERAQGTTEYAILVGVLVVLGFIAIIAFRDKVSELWTAISDGINGL